MVQFSYKLDEVS